VCQEQQKAELGEAGELRNHCEKTFWPATLSGDELLSSVDVICCSRKGRVDHQVNGECRHVCRSDNATDGKRVAEMTAPVLEFIAEQGRRQRRVDEAGGDQVDANGRKLKRQGRGKGGERSGHGRHNPKSDAGTPSSGSAHEDQRASGSYLVRRIARYLKHQHGVVVEGAPPLLEVQVEKAPVARASGCDHHMVDRGRQVTEETFEGSRISGIEGCGAQHFELGRRTSKALGIPAGEDYAGPFRTRSAARFQADAGATADYNNSLTEELRLTLDRRSDGCCAHDSSVWDAME
jgi:hypothetical protein